MSTPSQDQPLTQILATSLRALLLCLRASGHQTNSAGNCSPGSSHIQGLMGGSWWVKVPAPSPLGGITMVHTLHSLPLVPLVLNPVTPSRTCSWIHFVCVPAPPCLTSPSPSSCFEIISNSCHRCLLFQNFPKPPTGVIQIHCPPQSPLSSPCPVCSSNTPQALPRGQTFILIDVAIRFPLCRVPSSRAFKKDPASPSSRQPSLDFPAFRSH